MTENEKPPQRTFNGDYTASSMYERLGVSRTATKAEILAAYRVGAYMFHQDTGNGNTEALTNITDAKNTLIDPQKRAEHDKLLKALQDEVDSRTEKLKKIEAARNALKNPDTVGAILNNLRILVDEESAFLGVEASVIISILDDIHENYTLTGAQKIENEEVFKMFLVLAQFKLRSGEKLAFTDSDVKTLVVWMDTINTLHEKVQKLRNLPKTEDFALTHIVNEVKQLQNEGVFSAEEVRQISLFVEQMSTASISTLQRDFASNKLPTRCDIDLVLYFAARFYFSNKSLYRKGVWNEFPLPALLRNRFGIFFLNLTGLNIERAGIPQPKQEIKLEELLDFTTLHELVTKLYDIFVVNPQAAISFVNNDAVLRAMAIVQNTAFREQVEVVKSRMTVGELLDLLKNIVDWVFQKPTGLASRLDKPFMTALPDELRKKLEPEIEKTRTAMSTIRASLDTSKIIAAMEFVHTHFGEKVSFDGTVVDIKNQVTQIEQLASETDISKVMPRLPQVTQQFDLDLKLLRHVIKQNGINPQSVVNNHLNQDGNLRSRFVTFWNQNRNN